MQSNVLIAFNNLLKSPIAEVANGNTENNRINSMGDGLESYVKDLFCDCIGKTESVRQEEYAKVFSYTGNSKNPPDAMIRGGDAIEVKKTERNIDISFNSSYPKTELLASDQQISKECRASETWTVKDMLYVVGMVNNNELKELWFFYGDTYAANASVYKEKLLHYKNLLGGECETKELARIKKIDPLDDTVMRVRAMFTSKHPSRKFNYLSKKDKTKSLLVRLLLTDKKYNSLPQADRERIESTKMDGFLIQDVKVCSPDNPEVMLSCKFITYEK